MKYQVCINRSYSAPINVKSLVKSLEPTGASASVCCKTNIWRYRDNKEGYRTLAKVELWVSPAIFKTNKLKRGII
jgi:hypothetical protein